MRTFMKCLGAVLAVVWLVCVAIWLIEGENALGFFGVAFVLFVAFATLTYKILKSLAKPKSDSPQNQKRRHLIATLGLAALAAVCFGLLTWALIEGAVVEARSGSTGTKGFGNPTRYGAGGQLPQTALNIINTREDNPEKYWTAIGLLAFWGTLFIDVAATEFRSYRIYRDSQGGETLPDDLMAKIDHACKLFPEGREALLRAKTALLELNSPEVEAPLDYLLEKVLRAPDREAALKEIKGLAKGLDLFANF
jgi:hypothetical protein